MDSQKGKKAGTKKSERKEKQAKMEDYPFLWHTNKYSSFHCVGGKLKPENMLYHWHR